MTSNAARELAALRQRVDKPCEVCGKMMYRVLKKQRYDSRACAAKAYRARQKGQDDG